MGKAIFISGLALGLFTAPLLAQQTDDHPGEANTVLSDGLKTREQSQGPGVTVPRGTRVPLVLINSISTKHASPGDRVYLESVYPVPVAGRIVVPPGTYVSGTVTSVKRPGRVKGRGELFLRFEQLILPNGTIRDLVGRVGALDGRSPEDFDREEGKVSSESNRGGDARSVGEATAAAGLIGVLASRGPEAILEKGTQLDMVLDRDLFFTEEEVTFENVMQRPGANPNTEGGPDPRRNRDNRNRRGLGRFPL